MKHFAEDIHARRLGRLSALAAILFCSGAALAAGPLVRAGRRCIGAFRSQHLWRSAIERPADMPGAPAAWLTVREAGIDTLVTHDAGRDGLSRFPCVAAGNRQATIVMAHRDTHFRALAYVSVGMAVRFQRPGEPARAYMVVETEVLEAEQAEGRLRDKAHEDWLVLVTCYPFHYIGPAPQRFLVWARPCPQQSTAISRLDNRRPMTSDQ